MLEREKAKNAKLQQSLTSTTEMLASQQQEESPEPEVGG